MSYTDFKEVTSNNAGSTTRYGGNDVKEIMQIFNNKVVSNRRPKIKNEWIFADHFDIGPPATEPANPTDTNATRIYVDPTDFKLRAKKTDGTIRTVENVEIPDSALNQITNKAKLPSSILYNDQNNTLGDAYLDIGDIVTPSNPSAGIRRMFVDTATGELSVRTAAGTTVTLEGVGGGGGGDVYLNQANTHGDFDNTFRSSRVKIRNPANTFGYSIVASAIAAARNVTLPLLTGNDTFVTEAFAQTLTNKTIAAGSNTVSGISDAHIATHTSTKISITAKGQLNANAVYTDQANSFGDFNNSFRNGKLILQNPANTFGYFISTSAITAARFVLLPLIAQNETFVLQDFTQTVTNKTVNTTDNTVTATSQATGDILKNNGTKFVRMARGTALQVLRTNSGATDLEWASLDSERVGKSTASGNGTSTAFTIAHGLGSLPTYTFISVANSGTSTIAAKADSDATNITVTFNTPPSSGTNNVVIYWRVVA